MHLPIRLSFLVPALFCVASQTACIPAFAEPGHVNGQGEVVRHPFTVPEFHGLVVEGALDVELTPSTERSVVVEAQANIAELVTTEVRDGIWYIGTKESYSTNKPFVVHIALPTLDRLSVEGSGDAKGMGLFKLDRMDVSVEGSGDVDLELDAQDLRTRVQGSGDMDLKGRCATLSVDVDGSGDVDAGALLAGTVKVSVAGSGEVKVHATDDLTATVTGSGNILYRGSPAQVHRNVTGSGEVRALND